MSLEAAIRETFEEVGITINPEDLKHILTYKDKYTFEGNDNIYNEIFDCYIAKVKEIDMKKIVLQESEVADSKLVSKEEFKNMVENDQLVDRAPFYKELVKYLFKV